MNKQELIDNAVEDLKGKWSACDDDYLEIKPGNSGDYSPYWYTYESNRAFCSAAEFKKRARELGWINGYKWGVEYETNGKKPDLPDDCIVGFFGAKNEWRTPDKVINWALDVNKKFRIVDERYKPVEVEQVQADWYDYDNQRAIALPPVGAKIEFNYQSEVTWEVSHVVAIHHFRKDLILAPFDSSGKLIYANELSRMRPLDYNRNADEEKRKFVERVISVIDTSHSYRTAAGDMYDAGCRFK